MHRLSLRLPLFLFLSSASTLVSISACTSEPSYPVDEIDAATGKDGGRSNDGGANDGKTNDREDASDSSTPSDGGKDADARDGSDGGPWEPIPGNPCPTVGDIYERACGTCGTQTASCSPSKIVTGFGQCVEPVGACVPNTTENNAACGFCGTSSRTCNAQCEWVAQPCQGEVTTPDRCIAGTTQNRNDGCPEGVTRPWTCNASCAWDPPTMTCEEAVRALTIGTTVGATVNRDFTQLGEKIKRLTASSTPCSLSVKTDTHFIYIEVRNPNATPAKVDIGLRQATGQAVPNVLISAYSTVPADDNARKACLTGAELACFDDIANYKACLFGSDAPTIPANGSVWIYIGNYDAPDAPLTFNLSAKVTAL
ncbi:MAG: repeat domain protein [Labilithrix sp.]|nr:repeat domain protein [Labilithrix sp.]